MYAPRRTALSLGTVLLLSLLPWFSADGSVGDRVNLDFVARWGHGPCYAARVNTAGDLLIGSGSVLAVHMLDPTGSVATSKSELLLPAVVMGLHVEGDLVWVANGKAGVSVVDLSDPFHPTLLASFDLPSTANECARAGDHLYVACEDGGLRVLDASVPSALSEVGAYETSLYAMDVVVSGSVAFVADMYDSAVKVFDISDPTNPSLVHTRSVAGPPWSLDLRDDLLAVVDDYATFTLLDVTTPTSTAVLDEVYLQDLGYDVELADGLAYIANDWKGLTILDVSTPSNVFSVNSFDTPGHAFCVDVSGDRAYVADQHGGVRILDLASLPGLSEVGRCEGFGQLRHVHTEGTLSYAVDEWHGLRILQPAYGGGAVLLGSVAMNGSPQRVDVEGGLACVASTTAGVRVIDVSDPRAPHEVSWIPLPTYSLGSGAMDVSMDGGRVAVIDKYWGFYLFDLSNPASPLQIAELGTAAYPRGVVLRGDFAYVADHAGSMRIFDVSAAPAIVQAAFVPGTGYNYDIELEGFLTFVSKDWRGVWILDVTNPYAPLPVTTLDTPGAASSCSAEYPYLYVAEGSRLRVYDYTNPLTATQIGEYVCPDFTLGVSAADRIVHVAGMNAGWTALANSLLPVDAPSPLPTAIQLEANQPNPFNPGTSIRFALARSEWARLYVVDARGRIVRILVEETLSSGTHLRSWDGRDERGERVASGVYRYRLETATRAQTRGMVLLK